MNNPPDLTVALTAHSETIVGGPTILSAEAAIAKAEEAGFTVERLIGLDSASEGCEAFFSSDLLAHWTKVKLKARDLGIARNLLAANARGKWIAFLDADDLFSENWLSEGSRALSAAEQRNQDLILHPEANIFFDAANSVLLNINQDDDLYTPYYWYAANYYDSLVMAPRRAFLDVPYIRRDKETGFGYEDWRWNLDTISAGWTHQIVKDTIIFKRRQDMSLVVELGQQRAMLWNTESLTINNLARHLR